MARYIVRITHAEHSLYVRLYGSAGCGDGPAELGSYGVDGRSLASEMAGPGCCGVGYFAPKRGIFDSEVRLRLLQSKTGG